MTTSLRKVQHVADLLEAKKRLLSQIDTLLATRDEINQICKIAFDYQYGFSTIVTEHGSWHHKEDILKNVEKLCWRRFIEHAGVEKIMTKNAINKLRDELEKNPPEFCEKEIEIILANARSFYGEHIEQTLKEVYDRLIGCHYWSGHLVKKDNLRGVKMSFRMRGNIEYEAFFGSFRYQNYNRYNAFDFEDLYTVCKILDSRSRFDYSDTFHAAAETSLKDGGSKVNTKYFDVQCYKNGNQKVSFKRPDLLDMLNRYGSNGGRLPDYLSKRYKAEHFERP